MKIIKFDTIDSTNLYLKNKIKNNDINLPVCIQSDIQTKGKGRHDRKWDSQKGGLYFSIGKKIKKSEEVLLSPLKTAVILHKFLSKQFNLKHLSIKWPNDIYFENFKLAGILPNGILGEKNNHVVIGIGLNVNNEINIEKSISLKNILHKNINIDKLLIKLIKYYEKNEKIKSEKIVDYINKNLHGKGKLKKLNINDKIVKGVIKKVNRDCSLKIKIKNKEKNIKIGE